MVVGTYLLTMQIAERVWEQPVLPYWMQWIVLIAGVVTAVGMLWSRALRPLMRIVVVSERVLPLLEEITSQFRHDEGNSLVDVVKRVEGGLNSMESRLIRLETRVRALDVQLNPEKNKDRLRSMLEDVVNDVVDQQREDHEEAADV